jgi:predicted alpha/beta-fold hydrolase
MAPGFYWLEREFGRAPTAAVGYSLGGNMLACLLAKEGNDIPMMQRLSSLRLSCWKPVATIWTRGFSRVYQRYLLNLLKANASRKLEAYPGSLPVSRPS